MEVPISHAQIVPADIAGTFSDGCEGGTMHRILCFGAMFALAASEHLGATCTVLIAAHDFGILAADCIETHRDGSQSAACKISTGNGLAVTLAGMVSDGNTGLDLMAVATSAMAKSDSPLEAAEHFAAIAIQEIARSLDRQRTEASEMWRNRLGGVLARAVFAGVQGGKAALVVRTIEVSSKGLVVDLGSEVIVSQAKPRVLVYCEKAAELLRSDSSLLKSADPGRVALQLVHGAVAIPGGTRAENALYVTVIRVGQNGVKWLNRGACADEARTSKPSR